ncbi:MAG: lpdA [Acidimicrobiia bacterium]|nr:lpdA [Acidimicrobiia bacterium]
MSEVVDIAILGGGPAGYATALRAAGHGLTVTIVEGDLVGGTCLHRGCIPSKALLHVAHLADQVAHQSALGLAVAGPGLDVEAAGRFRDGVVGPLHKGLEQLLRSRHIEVVRGWGTVSAPGEISVRNGEEQSVVRARHVVIATGSSAVDLAIAPPDGDRILRSDDALRLARVPASAVVVGAGAVGVEFASMWCSLGTQVTLVEAADRVLPLEDSDSSKALARAFTRRGIAIRVGAALAGVQSTEAGAVVTLADGTVLTVDQVLVAVGRRPLTRGIGLEALGVLDERGYVAVDPLGRTAVDGLWAIGDAIPTLALAHAAFAEGFVVADAIAGLDPTPVDHHLVPRVTYCVPEVASVGLTETEARRQFPDPGSVVVTTGSMAGNARASIEGMGGQVKLVCHADGTLLGAHVVGPAATELISELGLAVSWEALAGELADVVHAHPTLSESIRETALAASGRPFHTHG